MLEGWQCPQCKRVWGPQASQCGACNEAQDRTRRQWHPGWGEPLPARFCDVCGGEDRLCVCGRLFQERPFMVSTKLGDL